jgi:hypothetical protein
MNSDPTRISGKGGWEKTTRKFPLFTDDSSIKSSTQKSFVFISDQADTAMAHIAVAENVEIDINEEGKSPFLNPVLGYDFSSESRSLAAVQVLPANRWYVWIRDDLDPDLKFVLASAAAAMLIRMF